MKSLLSASHNVIPSLLSSASNKSKWNSMTNVIITNPTLLILESCTTMFQLKQIHARMTRTHLITDLFPVSRLLAFCALADAGDIHYANLLFSQIEKPNTYIVNTMVRGYTKAKIPHLGFSFFRRMIRDRIEMDSRSFVFALKACEQFSGDLAGKSVHCRLWTTGFDSYLLVRNGLIHFYADSGSLGFARQVFDECPVRDVFSWTSMIDGYVTHNCSDEAMELFNSMLVSDVEPNEITMIRVLSACSQKRDLSLGRSIHDYIRKKNVNCSLNLSNAMLDMYVKCGCLVAAREIFDSMEMMDVFTWTSMVNGYAKCGELDFARKLFDEMPERNVVSWNAMIGGYSQNNQPKESLKLFHDMIEAGLVPTENTLVCVLSACGRLNCLDLGQWIHGHYIKQKRIPLSVILGNAFIDMYAKCGSIDAAAALFRELPERNLVSWNSMILGYAAHGRSKQFLILFEEMKNAGLKPDDITFVGVLSACSHGGLETEGREYFRIMERNFGLKPKGEHYACMIDLLGRIGHLEEAYDMIRKMPMEEATEAAWGSLLNACNVHGNVELAKLAAHKLLELDPEDSGIYAILANVCANNRRWDDVRMVRSMMRERGVRKIPGHSLIELKGEFHQFFAADETHPESKEICKVLKELSLLFKFENHVPITSQMINFGLYSDDLLYNSMT